MIQISLVNQSTQFKDADLPTLATALQIQIKRDLFPVWGITAQMYYTPTGKHATASHWVLALLDNADQAGALGYHDVTPAGLPLGKVFVATTLSAGDLVSVTASHELCEMLGDPEIDLGALDGTKLWAYELSDAVEDDQFGYDIQVPASSGVPAGTVRVSDFVTPQYFQSSFPGPYDFRNQLTKPLTLLPGGYMSYLDLNNPSAGWQQINARRAGLSEADSARREVMARPHAGSRRQRRVLGRHNWVRSTYAPGKEAVSIPASE